MNNRCLVPRSPPPAATERLPDKLHLPLVGEIRSRDFSLPALTLLLGALDGFNPCAMWTLVFLIKGPADVGLGLAAFASLVFWNIPPRLVVIPSALGGWGLAVVTGQSCRQPRDGRCGTI